MNINNAATTNNIACTAKAQNARRQNPKVAKLPPTRGPQNADALQMTEIKAISRGISEFGNRRSRWLVIDIVRVQLVASTLLVVFVDRPLGEVLELGREVVL